MTQYDVILADPPWWFANRLTGKGRTKFGSGAGGHYPMLKAHQIIDPAITLDVKTLAKRNSVLFMWVTWSHLYDTNHRTLTGIKSTKAFPLPNDALTVVQGWGFNYSTGAAWGKTTKTGKIATGTGHYFGGSCEPLLVATRGKFMTPKAWGGRMLTPGLFLLPKRGHSQKPDEVHTMIEAMYPGAEKLELFARRPKVGWDVWGNEVESTVMMEGRV